MDAARRNGEYAKRCAIVAVVVSVMIVTILMILRAFVWGFEVGNHDFGCPHGQKFCTG